jgi:hypothetical protein
MEPSPKKGIPSVPPPRPSLPKTAPATPKGPSHRTGGAGPQRVIRVGGGYRIVTAPSPALTPSTASVRQLQDDEYEEKGIKASIDEVRVNIPPCSPSPSMAPLEDIGSLPLKLKIRGMDMEDSEEIGESEETNTALPSLSLIASAHCSSTHDEYYSKCILGGEEAKQRAVESEQQMSSPSASISPHSPTIHRRDHVYPHIADSRNERGGDALGEQRQPQHCAADSASIACSSLFGHFLMYTD